MDSPFFIIVVTLGIFAAMGIVGVVISIRLNAKERHEDGIVGKTAAAGNNV